MRQIDWLIFAHLKFFYRTCYFFTIWDLLLVGNSNVEDEYYCDIAYLEQFTFNNPKPTKFIEKSKLNQKVPNISSDDYFNKIEMS